MLRSAANSCPKPASVPANRVARAPSLNIARSATAAGSPVARLACSKRPPRPPARFPRSRRRPLGQRERSRQPQHRRAIKTRPKISNAVWWHAVAQPRRCTRSRAKCTFCRQRTSARPRSFCVNSSVLNAPSSSIIRPAGRAAKRSIASSAAYSSRSCRSKGNNGSTGISRPPAPRVRCPAAGGKTRHANTRRRRRDR